MKSAIHIPLIKNATVLVHEGAKVTPETVLAEFSQTVDEIIDVAKMLDISPSKVGSLLTKSVGTEIHSGEVLAMKKGVFSTALLKSPIEGTITHLNENDGTVTLSRVDMGKSNYSIPLKGTVKKVSKTGIEIEVEGTRFEGKEGFGKDAYGQIHAYENNEILTSVGVELENTILATSELSEEAQAKCDVLGVSACIVAKPLETTAFPWIFVSSDVFAKISHLKGFAWVRPEVKEVIILSK
ncbi:hypothetical protein HYW55_01465 [Candidatus Gottesmanbacteria bacterium]|nr:hypothetical protein [Candidatus Gottesmanbacteria bacterium]